jgi:hypothetical protein
LRNDIYSPGPEENNLPDTYHQKARVYLIDKTWPTAIQSAMYMFQMSLDQILNPAVPVALQPEQIAQPLETPKPLVTEIRSEDVMTSQTSQDPATIAHLKLVTEKTNQVYRVHDEAA